MAYFEVRVHGPTGTRSVEIDAIDATEAERKASRQGQVLSVKRKRNFAIGGLTFNERQVFLSRLAAMLGSRVGGGDALRLIRDTFSGNVKKTAHQLLIKVEGGADIPRAIEELGPPSFPSNVVAMIRAGAKSGETWRSLQEAIKFEQQMEKIKRSSTQGLAGSLFGIAFAAGFIIAARFHMYPKLMSSSLMEIGSGAVDISWAEALTAYVGYAMVGVVALLALLGMLATVGRKIAPSAADAIILRIPFYKDMVLAKNNYIAFYGLSLLVRTGVRLRDAISLTAQTLQRGALRNDMMKAADNITGGKEWASALRSLHATDRAALASSLDSVQMARSLEAIAEQYMTLYEQRLNSFVPTMKAITSIFIILGGVIMFALVILPMLQVMQGALG
jgi:general secretion pathway protein F